MSFATHFDAYAETYDETLNAGLRVSGENSGFFADRRIEATGKALTQLAPWTGRTHAIDFGCGTGKSSKSLKEDLGFDVVHGLDVSPASLAVAAAKFDDPSLKFQTIDSYTPMGKADFVFCNGVFHHIPADNRAASLSYIHAALKPNGVFAFWENNPWNPGVHYIMSRIPFDRDAEMILPHNAVRMLRKTGFRIAQLRFFFIFPKTLAFLRPVEPAFSRLPLGAQYQIIAIKERS